MPPNLVSNALKLISSPLEFILQLVSDSPQIECPIRLQGPQASLQLVSSAPEFSLQLVPNALTPVSN